jgi:hypothetical protein
MKLYQHTNGIFYEKQADCPSRSFETVEFPFAASPKADFVAWLNQNAAIAKAHVGKASSAPLLEVIDEAGTLAPEHLDAVLPVDRHVAKVADLAPAAPQPFFGPQHPLTVMAIEDWCEAAQPHQLGIVVRSAAQRLQVIAQEQENRMKGRHHEGRNCPPALQWPHRQPGAARHPTGEDDEHDDQHLDHAEAGCAPVGLAAR